MGWGEGGVEEGGYGADLRLGVALGFCELVFGSFLVALAIYWNPSHCRLENLSVQYKYRYIEAKTGTKGIHREDENICSLRAPYIILHASSWVCSVSSHRRFSVNL